MADLVPGENNFVKDLTQRYKDAKALKMPFEADWRRVAELGLPRHYGGWVTTNAPSDAAGMGAARQSRINTYDSTLSRALPIYAAVLERMLTPGTQQYHTLTAEEDKDKKSATITRGLERLNNALFRKRYEPAARFTAAQGETYLSCGAYGNAGKLITWRQPNKQLRARGGFLYRNVPFRNLFWEIDDEEQIRTKFRRIDWTCDQAMKALGDKCPKPLVEECKNPSRDRTRKWEFYHCVTPSQDWDETALDYRRHSIGSYYVFVDEPTLVREPGGYSSDPLIVSRMATEGGNPYGYGAAQLVLSTVSMLQAQKKTWLRQGQLAVQPTLLVRDDGVMNVELVPGAQIAGGVNSQGQKMVVPLEQGSFQIVEKLMQSEQADVKEVMFARIFEILKDQPQKTATEVLDIAAREAAQLSPTMGRMQAEDLGPQIEREIELLVENNALPEGLPSELSEMPYNPIYTSPLAKSQHSESVSGFMRIAEMAMNVSKMTGDTRPVRRLNFDIALPAIAEQQSVPASWIKTDDEMKASDADVAGQQQTQQVVDALPGVAGMLKATQDNNLKPAPT